MQLLIDGKCWKIQQKYPRLSFNILTFSRPRSYVDDITVTSSRTQGFSNSSTTAKYTSSHGNGKSYSYETDNTNLLLVPSALRDKAKKPRYELRRVRTSSKTSLVHLSHCSKSSFFVQKFNFDFPRKLSIFWGEKLAKMLRFWAF